MSETAFFGAWFRLRTFLCGVLNMGECFDSAMKEYLRNKLLELKKHHNAEIFLNNYCTKQLKKQWERDRKQPKWEDIMCMADVQNYVERYSVVIDRYMDTQTGVDVYYVNLALYRATYAIEKMVNCYDNNRCEFYFENTSDVDNWFDNLYKLINIMQEETDRRSQIDEN